MKINLSVLLAALLALSLFSCKKDILNESFADDHPDSYKHNFKVYQWSEKEKNFFSLNQNPSSISLDMRSEEYPTIYQPLLVEAYNEIARQNEIHGFVGEIATKVGYPDWSRSYVSKNDNSQKNLVIIPLSFDNQNKLSGLIIASKQTSSVGSRWSINGMSREELLSAQTGNPLQKGALAHWVLKYEYRYYQTENEALKDAYCTLKTRGEDENIVNSPVFNPPPDCTWRILEICSDDETQIFWQAGVDMIPPHLDHDRDGILNQNDQDWHEFMQRHNITQEQFTQAIDSWWEDHYQDEYGDYDNFWDEFYLDGGGEDVTDFLNNLWNDLEDFFDSIFEGDNPMDYDPEIAYCPFDDPFQGNGTDDRIGFRDVRCNFYYILDCGSGSSNWWQFTDWIICPNCTEQDIENENQWFYIRLNAYIDYYRLDNYRDLLLSITANVPVLLSEDEVFQLFSTAFLDHFLGQHPSVSLSASERTWLIGRPGVIGALWDHSNITGQGDVSEQNLHVIIQLCGSLGLNEAEAIWLIQDAHLHGGESPVGEEIDDLLENHQHDNTSKTASIAYLNLVRQNDAEINEFIEDFKTVDIGDPLWAILKELLADAFTELLQEQLADLIPGGSLVTIGPLLLDNLQQGNMLDALYNLIDIVLNEADIILPWAKVASLGIAVYDKYKLLTKVYKGFKQLKSAGQESVMKLYDNLKQHLGGPGAILRKWKWDGGQQSILEGVNRQQFFEDLKNRFNITEFFTYQGNPVFKLYQIPNNPSGAAVYITAYSTSETTDPNTGLSYPLSIKFYIGPATVPPNGTNPNSSLFSTVLIIRLR